MYEIHRITAGVQRPDKGADGEVISFDTYEQARVFVQWLNSFQLKSTNNKRQEKGLAPTYGVVINRAHTPGVCSKVHTVGAK